MKMTEEQAKEWSEIGQELDRLEAVARSLGSEAAKLCERLERLREERGALVAEDRPAARLECWAVVCCRDGADEAILALDNLESHARAMAASSPNPVRVARLVEVGRCEDCAHCEGSSEDEHGSKVSVDCDVVSGTVAGGPNLFVAVTTTCPPDGFCHRFERRP